MSDIVFSCPECRGDLNVDKEGEGRLVPCPLCGKQIRIPQGDRLEKDGATLGGMAPRGPSLIGERPTITDKALDILKKATNIQPILSAMRSGAIIRKTLGVIGQTFAVLLGIVLLILWLKAWTFLGDLNFFGGLALIIWQFAFLYASLLALKVLFVRAGEIKHYPDSDYIVIPIMATLLKANGEMTFVFMAVMSIPAMILVWLGGSVVRHAVSVVDVGNVFLSGILAFLLSWVVGFLALLLTRLLAEWTLALFSIANDVNILRKKKVGDREERNSRYD